MQENDQQELTPDQILADDIARFWDDPLGFVLYAYPWGVEGTELENEEGPDEWQRKLLIQVGNEVRERNFNGIDAVKPLRFTRASGHGIGKSTMIAWLANWIMSTRPKSKGTVTANTFAQLETKTWPEVKRWTKLCITGHWFHVGQRGLYHLENQESWYLNCQTCNEENSEAFAGQHQKRSTSYYLLDEASAIPPITWQVLEGGLTDGEPMVFAFGNPTRNTGVFYEINFGDKRHRWNYDSIDSRTCRFSNKELIDEWIQDWGIDHDFCRVRVLGIPPQEAEDQLIGRDLIREAQQRHVRPLPDDPLVAGVDVPDGGGAWFIVRFRRGLDGRNVPKPIRMAGSKVDRNSMIAILSKVMQEGVEWPGRTGLYKPAAMFVDSAFGAPIVERLHTLGIRNVHEINFGGRSPDHRYYNMRAYMWWRIKEWLDKGSIEKSDTKFEIDLMGPGWHYSRTNAYVVESKEDMKTRGVPSPDDGDAFALTFARNVAPLRPASATESTSAGGAGWAWG